MGRKEIVSKLVFLVLIERPFLAVHQYLLSGLG
jgi:hypothetical protein